MKKIFFLFMKIYHFEFYTIQYYEIILKVDGLLIISILKVLGLKQ